LITDNKVETILGKNFKVSALWKFNKLQTERANNFLDFEFDIESNLSNIKSKKGVN